MGSGDKTSIIRKFRKSGSPKVPWLPDYQWSTYTINTIQCKIVKHLKKLLQNCKIQIIKSYKWKIIHQNEREIVIHLVFQMRLAWCLSCLETKCFFVGSAVSVIFLLHIVYNISEWLVVTLQNKLIVGKTARETEITTPTRECGHFSHCYSPCMG